MQSVSSICPQSFEDFTHSGTLKEHMGPGVCPVGVERRAAGKGFPCSAGIVSQSRLQAYPCQRTLRSLWPWNLLLPSLIQGGWGTHAGYYSSLFYSTRKV